MSPDENALTARNAANALSPAVSREGRERGISTARPDARARAPRPPRINSPCAPPCSIRFSPPPRLPGVGPKNAKLLDRLLDRPQGARVIDVLFHLPYATLDRRARPKIRDAARTPSRRWKCASPSIGRPRAPARRRPYKVLVEDDTGDVELVFFLANHRLDQEAPAARRDALGVGQARNVGRPFADGPSRPGDGRRGSPRCRRSSRSMA